MPDWSRIANTTIKKYIRKEEVNILRNRIFTDMVQKKGRISFNWGGTSMDWKVRYRRARMIGYADTDTLTFNRVDRWKTASLEYRGYAIADSITKLEKLQNKNSEAIVNLYDGMAKNLVADMKEEFCDEVYINGYGTGNNKRLHGTESFMSGGTASAGNKIATPTVTNYAGLSTVPGAYGGNWTGTWPAGTGDPQYDFWSPLLIDYTNTGWPQSTKTWPNTCVQALRFGIIKARKSKGLSGMVDLVMLNDDLFTDFLNAYDPKERINIYRGKADGDKQRVGFDALSIMFDGAEVTWEFGMPAATGYGWNLDQVELRSMQPQLFMAEGPDYDIGSKSYRFTTDYFGNLVFNPRSQVKWFNYT